MPATLIDTPARVGINGFGRIGRASFRASLDRTDLVGEPSFPFGSGAAGAVGLHADVFLIRPPSVVAINHTAPSLDYLLHAIKYDSTHGTCKHADKLAIVDGALVFDGTHRIELFSERDPTKLDWSKSGAEYIIESTGKMTTVELASQHIHAAKGRKVVISAPSKDAPTIVVGVNRLKYQKDMDVVSNASCTTNCLAPLAKVLETNWGIKTGMMTTIHASTSSQPILDGFSKKSRRLGRGVGSNIIPTTTGAAKAVQLVLPELAGKFTGISVRVPVNNVSMVDLTVTFNSPVASKEALLEPLRAAAAGVSPNAAGPLSNIICVNDDELVSSDFLGYDQSCIVDAGATVMLDDYTAKIVAWYDNEWAYSVRILDLIAYMSKVDLAE
ncbi:glyceraldehyde-3-phosphate dehydrogenase, type I [Pseudohyphozyma bogoriensis]|nr:glyceraldehyde-3-phosphate dehydrogenase, type I [Pseudohyphozyma bogoriensis]